MIYSVMYISTNYQDELRTLLGVTATELPDTLIDTDVVVGQAEQYVLTRVPNYAALTSDLDVFNLNMAIIYMLAFFVAPGMKLRLLQSETDNKSVASRFKEALSALDPPFYKSMANSIIVGLLGVVPVVDQLTRVRPLNDAITGALN